MPVPAFCSIEGKRQGLITAGASTQDSVGGSWVKGHEDESIIQAFEHNIIIPRDPQSGQPSGQRVHMPAKLVKVYDKASPLLYNALCSGETLLKVNITWHRTNAMGKLEHYFTMTLEDALLVDIVAHMPNCQDPKLAHYTHLEDISFTYRKISWLHEKSSTHGADDWREPEED